MPETFSPPTSPPRCSARRLVSGDFLAGVISLLLGCFASWRRNAAFSSYIAPPPVRLPFAESRSRSRNLGEAWWLRVDGDCPSAGAVRKSAGTLLQNLASSAANGDNYEPSFPLACGTDRALYVETLAMSIGECPNLICNVELVMHYGLFADVSRSDCMHVIARGKRYFL